VYAKARERAEQGVRTASIDEMTGVQALERKEPDKPMQPASHELPKGRVLYREFEYIRHGTLSFFINLDVAAGKAIYPSYGETRNEADMAAHIQKLIASDPTATKWRIVCDNLRDTKILKYPGGCGTPTVWRESMQPCRILNSFCFPNAAEPCGGDGKATGSVGQRRAGTGSDVAQGCHLQRRRDPADRTRI